MVCSPFWAKTAWAKGCVAGAKHVLWDNSRDVPDVRERFTLGPSEEVPGLTKFLFLP
jgi:hypothetical protein